MASEKQKVRLLGYDSVTDMCLKNKIKKPSWYYHRDRYPDIPEDKLLAIIKKKSKITSKINRTKKPVLGFRSTLEMCLYFDISESTWSVRKKQHPELSDEEVLRLILPDDQPIRIEPIKKTPFERLFFRMEKVDDRSTEY